LGGITAKLTPLNERKKPRAVFHSPGNRSWPFSKPRSKKELNSVARR